MAVGNLAQKDTEVCSGLSSGGIVGVFNDPAVFNLGFRHAPQAVKHRSEMKSCVRDNLCIRRPSCLLEQLLRLSRFASLDQHDAESTCRVRRAQFGGGSKC